ncbi:MAG: BMP family ABC transporter substrate-binding protein [Treponema sp.]|nr:MAG: BMP family ABC transporter substrate-binding protein [Treponema sp.]
MLKKISIFMLGAALVFTLVACPKSEEKEAGENVSDGIPTMRLVTDKTGISDKSFNASAWKGILNFYGDSIDNTTKRGKKYDVVTCPTQDAYLSVLKSTSDQEFDLVCMTGFTFADSAQAVAELYPNQKYMIADVTWLSAPNLMQIAFAEHEGSYLVGLATALKAKEDGIVNPKFGFIGGMPGSTITKFEIGYIQGIKAVFPDAEILDYYANDWGKPELAKTQAKNWFDSGVYAIFSAAGATGNGTIAQAKEYRMNDKNVWAIGVDSDQYEAGLYADGESAVLTSMLKKVDMATKYALDSVKDGTFKGEKVVLDLAKEGLGFSVKNKALSESIVAEVESAKKDIIAGNIKVFATYAAALEAGVAPEGLGAKDD